LVFYYLGLLLYKYTKLAICNPVLLSVIALIATLKLLNIEFEAYKEATKIFDFFLGMAVVCLGYLIYEQKEHIKGKELNVIISLSLGCIIGLITVIAISKVLGASDIITLSIAPKSVTAPVAIAIVEPFGANVAITAITVIFTGIFGNVFGFKIMSWIGLKNQQAKGLAMGASSHGIGTAKAIETSAIEGAMSGIAMGGMCVITAILFPIIWELFS
jgi:Putative effector of murein hydrolase